MFWIVCLAICYTEIAGQTLNCGLINSLDCGRYPISKVCGTDGVTYRNSCVFAKAQCKTSGLQSRYAGECSVSVRTTQPTTTTTTAGHSAQTLNCPWVRTLDCNSYPESFTCASNGVTFTNVCYLAKASCNDGSVHKAHDGACATPSTTTTTTTSSTTVRHTTIDSHCRNILNDIVCPDTFQPVCGSNGKIYPNMCYGSKAQCRDSSLKLSNDGPCFNKYTFVGRAISATTAAPKQ